MGNYKYDIEDRLIKFAIDIIVICGKIDGNFASQHLSKQLIRSAVCIKLW